MVLLLSTTVLSGGWGDRPKSERYCGEGIVGAVNARLRHLGSFLEHVVMQYGSLAIIALKTLRVKLDRMMD